MHEFGITSRIVQAVLRIAENSGTGAVAQVDLVIGKLTFLNHEQVRLAYDVLVRGTVLEGSSLHIESVEGAVRCVACGKEKDVSLSPLRNHYEPLPLFSCLDCGDRVEIIHGKECTVKGILMEE